MKQLLAKFLVVILFSIFQVSSLSSQCQDWTLTSYMKTDLGGGNFQYDVSFSFPAQGNFSAMITLKCLDQEIGGVACTGSLNGQSTYDLTIGSSPIDCADTDIVIEIVKFNSPNCGSTCGTQILPVVLLEFGVKQNSQNLEFYWVTTSEVNNDFFTLEESRDGLIYSHLDNIKGLNEIGENMYKHNIDVEGRSGLLYFRLSQSDFNGVTTELKTIKHVIDNEDVSLSIFPNPAFDRVNIISPNKISKVVIFDTNGTKIKSFLDTKNLDISDLKFGIYILQITNEFNQIKMVKLLVNH